MLGRQLLAESIDILERRSISEVKSFPVKVEHHRSQYEAT